MAISIRLRGLGRACLTALFGIAVTACSATPTPVVPSATAAPAPTVAASETARPAPTSAALNSPLAVKPASTPAAVAPGSSATPATAVAPIPGRGKVAGRAVRAAGSSGHPSFIVSGELYLGVLVPAADPKLPPAVAVSPGDAPHAQVNQATGEFVFLNVPPGTYALVMIGFSDSYVFERPHGGGRIDVKVEANKTTDLGDVTVK